MAHHREWDPAAAAGSLVGAILTRLTLWIIVAATIGAVLGC